MWKGSSHLLLQEYFQWKEELLTLKGFPKRFRTEEGINRIKFLEDKIKWFLSTLDTDHLKDLILMSLDVE